MICFTAIKDRRHWRRKNGWSLPLHPLQVLAWFFIIMFSVLYFGILVPSLPSGAWQVSANVINVIIFTFHIAIHLISVSLDPADINVRAKQNKGPLPTFDRKKHNHVIENQFCHICEVKVGRRSKHCSACNKCVSEFDHHCKWLNNCVGGRNYRLFLSCISSALLGCLLIFTLSLTLIGAYFNSSSFLYSKTSSRSHETSSPSSNNSDSFSEAESLTASLSVGSTTTPTSSNSSESNHRFIAFVPVNGSIWLSLVILTCLLSVLGIALLGHLLGFHIFLMCQNFSTYDYIVQKRDSDVSTNSNQNQPGSKFIRLPFRLLQQMKTKKANQITPESKHSNKDKVVELELQINSHRRSSDGKAPMLPSIIDKHSIADDEQREKELENYVGNVYIGSPHRRRKYLEPLHVRPKANLSLDDGENDNKTTGETVIVQVNKSEFEDEALASIVPEGEAKDEEKDSPQSGAVSHGLSKRHLRSPSPAPLLSPILESEISSASAIVSWKHRSVSEQSLHMLTEDEDADGAKDVSESSNKSEKFVGNNSSSLSHENSGSLSNLFMSANEQAEVIIETNNNCPDTTSILDEDDMVHEVHIKPQGMYGKDACLGSDSNKGEDCSDPFINGELWAYAPHNGCHLPAGVVSFRRSCSMQDECANNINSHLTRCRSEDEIKPSPKIIKLQRRMSENHVSWLVQDSKLSKKLKEHSPKSGISAAAVFCVEEPDEAFPLPNLMISKRKYGHFAVPNHVVLPCTNSIHPESRKRTRAVGSKPPKAFHA